MRVVVDTNVLVSGLLSKAGPPSQVVTDIVAGRLRLQLCVAILAEYRGVLPRPQLRLQPARVVSLLTLVEQTADWWPIPRYDGQAALPDESDWPFLACAMAAACPVITGNLKHYPAGLGLKVMTPREWLVQSRS